MPIACKVSNSEVNSVKRINNDAAIKATTWRQELGNNQVVPVASYRASSRSPTSYRRRKRN
jgi:hypothetical protein